MALPSSDKIVGDLGHTPDHNAIVAEVALKATEDYVDSAVSTHEGAADPHTAYALEAATWVGTGGTISVQETAPTSPATGDLHIW
jgi:hypothetical protein